jgi:sugar (pentulose or hexulose) kinase
LKDNSGGDLVIGIDCSTTAVKAVAWDFQGKPISTGRAPLEILSPQPGYYEQDATNWWAATCLALKQVLSNIKSTRVCAVSIAHQRESFVSLGNNDRPLRPAILWLDQRAHSLLPEMAAVMQPDKYHQRTGKPFSANLAPPKIEWMRRHEPYIYANTSCWLDVHAYLVYQLTGEMATSTGSADPLGLYDLLTNQWDTLTLSALHLDPSCLPTVYPPGTILGTVNLNAAAATGLMLGTPVAAGIGDGQAAALGMGIHASGSCSLSLGTSVIGGSFSPDFKTSLAFRTMSGIQGSYILETVILSGTQVLNWLITELLGLDDHSLIMERLETAASSIQPGSTGLILVPYWNGVMNPYWDSSASGILIGLGGHHRAEHIFRAALEGIAYELRLHLEGVESALSSPITELVVSGGGARNHLWLQIIADVTGKLVRCKADYEASSLGVAMLAATASGNFENAASSAYAMAAPFTKFFAPNNQASDRYADLYINVYRSLYPAIRAQMEALKKLE